MIILFDVKMLATQIGMKLLAKYCLIFVFLSNSRMCVMLQYLVYLTHVIPKYLLKKLNSKPTMINQKWKQINPFVFIHCTPLYFIVFHDSTLQKTPKRSNEMKLYLKIKTKLYYYNLVSMVKQMFTYLTKPNKRRRGSKINEKRKNEKYNLRLNTEFICKIIAYTFLFLFNLYFVLFLFSR